MIPLTLHLKNFLSYGPDLQTINFGPYPLICLSGKNGHGKTALLDAITWALWGQARKTLTTIKPDLGLLRLGQMHMMVIFDFELGENKYRVRREFTVAYGKQTTHLEFGMLNQETNTLISLTNKTIRTTQETIEKTIHIDFDSFINSAFLRQGNANEFSKKSSKERKDILAAILGLGQYDILRKKAMDKARNAAAEKQTLLMLQEKLLGELEKKELLHQHLTIITEQLNAITRTELSLDAKATDIELAAQNIAQEQHDASLILYQKEDLIKKQQMHQQTLQKIYTTWRSIHKKRLHLPDYSALYARKKKFTEEITIFQQTLNRQLEIKSQYLNQSAELQQYIKQLTLTHSQLIQKTSIEIESIRIELKNNKEHQQYLSEHHKAFVQEIAYHKHSLKQIPGNVIELLNTEIVNAESVFERRKEYYQQFRTRGSLIHNTLQQSIQKSQLVNDKQDPSCPLCEQHVSDIQRTLLQQKFIRHEQLLTHQKNRLLSVVKNLKTMLLKQHDQIQTLKVKAQQQITYALQHAEIIKNIQKLEISYTHIQEQQNIYASKEKDLQTRLAIAENYYSTLDQQNLDILHNNKQYQKLSAQLQKLDSELNTIHYNSQAHHKAQSLLHTIETQLAEYEHIQQENAHQEQRKTDSILLCHTLRTIKNQILDLTNTHSFYAHLAEKTALIAEEKIKLAHERKTYMHQKELLLQEKGSIHTQQKTLALLESEHALNQQKIKEHDQTIVDYQAIALATGKDGIQALLIEDAIPEIEQEANELLKKLTNNQAQIFIESLRDLKKGGTKETLDINISDATGIRPYELFSGGEAFRIDFALRIAISKLLARRAGTALQTLIIDEGFGSQDEEGLSHIMDALHLIQNDFSKVIIVSHLNAMKDQFPVHFVVEKTAQGSSITVIEQD